MTKSATALVMLIGFPLLRESRPPEDHLGIAHLITYNNTNFKLTWGVSVNSVYYRQEYLPSYADSVNYDKVLLIETLVGNFTIFDAVRKKLKELQDRKTSDPVVNYSLFNNPQHTEYLLDFVLSDGQQEPKEVEWNEYRYSLFVDKTGHKGVLMFGVAFKEKKKVKDFLSFLGKLRKEQIPVLEKYHLPEIEIK